MAIGFTAHDASTTLDTPFPLRAVLNPHGYHYLASRPQASSLEPQRRWPLLFFLHGAAERGDEVTDVARQGLPKLIAAEGELTPSERFIGSDIAARFVVIAPQCAHYEVWHEAPLLSLLEDVGDKFNVDPARVYLTGLSMGAFGVWSLGLRHPQRFAALAPICGGGRISDVAAAARNHPEALRTLGVWAFHGAQDRVVPAEESERMIEGLKQAGVAEVKLTLYPEGEHDAWSASYANPELYDWLLRHAR